MICPLPISSLPSCSRSPRTRFGLCPPGDSGDKEGFGVGDSVVGRSPARLQRALADTLHLVLCPTDFARGACEKEIYVGDIGPVLYVCDRFALAAKHLPDGDLGHRAISFSGKDSHPFKPIRAMQISLGSTKRGC
jgi:hypothetical protein